MPNPTVDWFSVELPDRCKLDQSDTFGKDRIDGATTPCVIAQLH